MRRPHCGYATVAASAAARHGAGVCKQSRPKSSQGAVAHAEPDANAELWAFAVTGRQEGGLFGRIFGGKSTPAAQTDRYGAALARETASVDCHCMCARAAA